MIARAKLSSRARMLLRMRNATKQLESIRSQYRRDAERTKLIGERAESVNRQWAGVLLFLIAFQIFLTACIFTAIWRHS